MLTTHNIEKKIPCTVLQKMIDNKSYQFVVDSDSDLDKCLEAICEIKDHLIKIKADLQEEQKRKAELAEVKDG